MEQMEDLLAEDSKGMHQEEVETKTQKAETQEVEAAPEAIRSRDNYIGSHGVTMLEVMVDVETPEILNMEAPKVKRHHSSLLVPPHSQIVALPLPPSLLMPPHSQILVVLPPPCSLLVPPHSQIVVLPLLSSLRTTRTCECGGTRSEGRRGSTTTCRGSITGEEEKTGFSKLKATRCKKNTTGQGCPANEEA